MYIVYVDIYSIYIVYTCVYIYIYMCVCVCMYVYIYTVYTRFDGTLYNGQRSEDGFLRKAPSFLEHSLT